MSEIKIQALSIEESVDAGFMPFTNTGGDTNDNPLVESILTGTNAPRYDARQRLVISFRQYHDLQERNAQMSQYALEMTLPSKPHLRQLVPASKYLKYWGQGLEVVGAPVEETHVFADAVRRLRLRGVEQDDAIAQARAAIAAQKRRVTAQELPEASLPEDVTIFWCRDKYPNCNRFYDNARGLNFHWRNDHGEAPITKAAKAKFATAEVVEESTSEE